MALSQQDISKGADMTGINPYNGGDLNVLVDNAQPVDDTNGEGKGLTLVTKDTAVDTPNVPNATIAGQTKWKRYFWIRIPYNTVVDKTPLIYAWNDNAPNDATLLKWVRLLIDTTVIENLANTALANSQQAITTANTANTTSNAANVSANTANTNANNALAQVAGATAAAANAVTQAATANSNATSALSNANSAVASANNAVNIANQATNISGNFVKIVERKNKGVDAANSAAGKNTRILNYVEYDPTPLISLDAVTGHFTVLTTGYYKICAKCAVWFNLVNSTENAQLFLVKNSDDSNLIEGNVHTFSIGIAAGVVCYSELYGVIQINANTVLRLDHYIKSVMVNGLGKASGFTTSGGDAHEIYSIVEIQKVG